MKNFRLRLLIGFLMLVTIGGFCGSALTLQARAQYSKNAEDAVRDQRLMQLDKESTQSAMERAAISKRIEDLERDNATARGALWAFGALTTILMMANLYLTISEKKYNRNRPRSREEDEEFI